MKFGLQARLMTGLVLATTALVMLIGGFWIRHDSRALDEDLVQRQQRMVRLIQRGMAGPIWNLDRVTVDNLLDAVMADPEVHSIELKGLGLRAESYQRSREGDAVDPLRHQFQVSYQPSSDSPSTLVADAVLVYSRSLLNQQVAGSQRFVMELLAGVLAAVVLSSYVLVYRWVRLPVERLGALAQRVAEGELGAQVAVERQDEIGELTERFNLMSRRLREASDGLRASEARYRSLFENATEGIFQADSQGEVLSMNSAFCQMLGLERPVTGRSLASLLGLTEEEVAAIARVFEEQGRLQQVPLELRCDGRRAQWVELSAHKVRDHGAVRIEGMLSDITQRHQAEAELTRHRDHLEELVAERTVELREATARAEAASHAKGRFLATVSHEFRTPLNGILGFTQILQMDASVAPVHQAKLAMIRESGEHLLALIADVLDMASIEAGKIILKPVAVDLRALVDVAADSVRFRAEQKHLGFSLDIDPALPHKLVLDGQRLRQVLLNLLSNAVKFTDTGMVRLALRVLERRGEILTLSFEVTDTGIGLSPAQQTRLFQPFERVSDGTRLHGGTGLGLSISQELVRLMGGVIQVRSEAGQGSCFSFELRLQAA